jgi:hypothetical protein
MTVETLRESGQKYRDQQLAEALEAPNPDEVPEPVQLGEEHPEETDAALERSLVEAEKQGLPPDRVASWREALWEIRSFWRTSLGGDPPAKVEPMRVRLKPGYVPTTAQLRTYSPRKDAWLALFMAMLVTFGLLFANPQAIWASAPLIREKGGAGSSGDLNSHRMTVDLRMVNAMTEKCPHPMPTLE